MQGWPPRGRGHGRGMGGRPPVGLGARAPHLTQNKPGALQSCPPDLSQPRPPRQGPAPGHAGVTAHLPAVPQGRVSAALCPLPAREGPSGGEPRAGRLPTALHPWPAPSVSWAPAPGGPCLSRHPPPAHVRARARTHTHTHTQTPHPDRSRPGAPGGRCLSRARLSKGSHWGQAKTRLDSPRTGHPRGLSPPRRQGGRFYGPLGASQGMLSRGSQGTMGPHGADVPDSNAGGGHPRVPARFRALLPSPVLCPPLLTICPEEQSCISSKC